MAFGIPGDEIKATLARTDGLIVKANTLIDESTALVREVRETVVVVKQVFTAIAAVIISQAEGRR